MHIVHCAYAKRPYFYIRSEIWHPIAFLGPDGIFARHSNLFLWLPLQLTRFLARSASAPMFQPANWKVDRFSLNVWAYLCSLAIWATNPNSEINTLIEIRIPVDNLLFTWGKIDVVVCTAWGLRSLSSITFERNLSGQFSPLTAPYPVHDHFSSLSSRSAPTPSFSRTHAHRFADAKEAHAHAIFGSLRSVFLSDPAPLARSDYEAF